MADLSGSDRAQLVLVGGLAVAVVIVVLALLMNGVIYTQNLATRGVDAGGQEALEVRNAVAADARGLVNQENRREPTDRGALQSRVETGLTNASRMTARYRLLDGGGGVSVSNVSLHDGTRVRQTEPTRNFSDAGGASDWNLTTDADGVRRFDMDVEDETQLASTTDPEADAFRAIINNSSDGTVEWVIYVYRDPDSNDDTTLAVKNGTESSATMDVCSPLLTQTPTINLTAGRVDGESCSAIDFAKGVDSPDTVRYEHSDRTAGTYNVTANTTSTGNVNGPDGSSPYEAPVVYSAAMDVEYEAPSVTYRTRVRVAPGDDDA